MPSHKVMIEQVSLFLLPLMALAFQPGTVRTISTALLATIAWAVQEAVRLFTRE